MQLNVLPLVLKHWKIKYILRNNHSGCERKHRELSSFPDPLSATHAEWLWRRGKKNKSKRERWTKRKKLTVLANWTIIKCLQNSMLSSYQNQVVLWGNFLSLITISCVVWHLQCNLLEGPVYDLLFVLLSQCQSAEMSL